MRIATKIVLTIIAIIIATPIFVLAQQVPILKLVLFAGLIAGIRAIWKYNPDNNNTNNPNDNHHLDKS